MFVKIKFEKLPINILKEGDYYVVLCPVLDISGYGTTIDQATESFRINFELTMEYLQENGNLLTDLEAHGFEIQDDRAVPPDYTLIGQDKINLELAHA